MSIDWDWIKQRPHFIAEELSKNNDVLVLYQFSFRRWKLAHNKKNNVKTKRIFLLPFDGKSKLFKIINDFVGKHYIETYIKKFKPDILWISYPRQIEWINKDSNVKTVYDCMDDYFSISNNKKILEQENKLLEKSNLIFVSSKKIERDLIKRNREIENKIVLIRNGFDGDVYKTKKYVNNSREFNICYFGTINKDWFDFEIINMLINDYKNINFYLYGPITKGTVIPERKQIKYLGIMNHNEILEKCREYDAMIMPFIPNDIVMSVDPVKMYEYINLNKNIISIKYDEIERFSAFVHFYSNYIDLKNIIISLLNDNVIKYSEKSRLDFLNNNSWENRSKEINNYLVKLF